MDVTIATHSRLPEGAPDDLLLAAELERFGADVRFAVWNDHAVDWATTPVTVVRSTWDYHLAREHWLGWIDNTERATRLINPAALLRWNTDKRYLLELGRSGVAVVPTLVIDRADDPSDVALAIRGRDWTDVVVKPSVGASARGTCRFGGTGPDAAGAVAHAVALAREGAALVQPFQEGVLTDRERSLVLIGGRYTHAFSKPAFDAGAAGGGGVVLPHEPSAAERELATCALATLPVVPAYARVDLVPTAAGPLLMELELIEPHLALAGSPTATSALADLILHPIPA